MMAEAEDLKKRVDQLEGEVADLWRKIRTIQEELKPTIEAMQKTIRAAEDFRDRVFTALQRATGNKPPIH